jgi:hypothetical protein
MKTRNTIGCNLLYSLALTIVLGQANLQGHESSPCCWECPNCLAHVEPIKFGCCAPDNKKINVYCYSVDVEEICFARPRAENRLAECIECKCPSAWNAWCKFTGSVVRDKRSLQKTVVTKDVTAQKCVVHYQCPHCKTEFKPSKPIKSR